MRIAEILYAMASWMESPDNEALQLAEYDDDCLKLVADSCVKAANIFKEAAEQVNLIEPSIESEITPENLDKLSDIAGAFDNSQDSDLKKVANVIDELILGIAAKNSFAERKDLLDNRLVELKKKYEGPREELNRINKTEESEKLISKSKYTDQFKMNQHGLSSRCCPDHAGSQLSRVGEHAFQCELDKRIYNYETGYTLLTGEQVPGGDVSLQTKNTQGDNSHSIFDTRETRLQTNR